MIAKAKLTAAVKRTIGTLILAMSIFFIVKNLKFYSLTPESLGKYLPFKWILIGHVAGGGLALLIGPFLVWKAVRERNFRLHRYMGRAYIYSVLVAGLCALYLAATTGMQVNWMYTFSLLVLASAWLAGTSLAWYFAVKKKFILHEEWAKRSYLLTIAFVAQAMLMYHPYIISLGTFGDTSPSVIWASWTILLFLFRGVPVL